MSTLLFLKSLLIARALKKSKKRKKIDLKNGDYEKCRVCNKENANIPIFNNPHNPNMAEDINNVSGVIISEEDEFSKHICQSCVNLLKGCVRFKKMCQKTNERFMKNFIKIEIEELKTKENKDESDDSLRLGENYEDKNNINESNNDFDDPLNSRDDYIKFDTSNETSLLDDDDDSDLWSCTTCFGDFGSLESYTKHLPSCVTVRDSKPVKADGKPDVFLCDVCGKTARSNANLLSHMTTHSNVFAFKCDQCSYKGKTPDLLRIHKRTHLKEKPFKCPHCPRAWYTRSNLKKHIQRLHTNIRPFQCTLCQKAFAFKYLLNRHVNDTHLKKTLAECDICFRKFSTRKIFYQHRARVHKLKCQRIGRVPGYLLYQMEQNKESSGHDFNT